MDHLFDFVAHVLLGHAVRRFLFQTPGGVVLGLALVAVLYLLWSRSARHPRRRSARRYRP